MTKPWGVLISLIFSLSRFLWFSTTVSEHLLNGTTQSYFFSIRFLIIFLITFSEFKGLAASCIKTYLDTNLDLFKAFLTLSDLVFPPFIISMSSKLLKLALFTLLITMVIFLNLSSLRKSILWVIKFLFLNLAKSLLVFDENRKLSPPARRMKCILELINVKLF